MPPLSLTETDRRKLENLTRRDWDSKATRRAYALLALDRGAKPTEVAARLGVTRSTVYEWVQRYLRRKHLEIPQRLIDRRRSGRPPIIRQRVKSILPGILKSPPNQNGYPASKWTIRLLQQHMEKEYQLAASRETVRRAMKDLE